MGCMGEAAATRALTGLRPGRTVALALALAALVLPGSAAAAELHVTSSADSGAGSLRDVIAGAGGGDSIIIDVGVDPVLTTGHIEINKSLTIVGDGIGVTNITADNDPPTPSSPFRAFVVNGGASVTFSRLSITGGRAPNGGMGPAGGHGGNGGGILADATVFLDRVSLVANRAGNGGTGATTGGNGGSGGGIYATGAGTVTLSQAMVTSNRAGNGGTGGLSAGGAGGSGGGIAGTGTINVIQSTVLGNLGGIGGGSTIGPKGNGGSGGGIAFSGGGTGLLVSGSTIAVNHGGAGADNNNPSAEAGTGGHGGGIHFDSDGLMTVVNSTLVGNFAGPGGAPLEEGPVAVGPGHGGDGGGIHFDGTPGAGNVVFATISNNDAGRGGEAGSHFGHGGGFYAAGDTNKLALRNTILSGNTAFPEGTNGPQCAGVAPIDGSGNLTIPGDPHCPGGFAAVAPVLDPFGLDNLGGPTETIALIPGSAAVDSAILCTDFSGATIGTDQRALPRPFGPRCDIGAFERQPLPEDARPRNPNPLSALKKKCRKRGKRVVKRKGKYRCGGKLKKKKKRR